MIKPINSEQRLEDLRKKVVNINQEKILISNFYETEQEQDLTEPANCNGYGRIRHFKLLTSEGWPQNKLPIEPAYKALGVQAASTLRTQLFQIAACNWRCWYCFVPLDLRSADLNYSKWFSASELIDLYLKECDPPRVIVLSGGQPDLVPEWILWMMSALHSRNLEHKVYLWSDDNLSSDFFWHFLNEDQIEFVRCYKNYGKVGCFKGFDKESFSFNTAADPFLFDKQFEVIERYINLGIDIYAYVTLTTPSTDSIDKKLRIFIDRLQNVDRNLPLRTIPLEIKVFTPVLSRINNSNRIALTNQNIAIKIWQDELKNRFSNIELEKPITDILFHKKC